MKQNIIIFLAVLLYSSVAAASGPFFIYPSDTGGSACVWKNGVVKWQYEDGALSSKIPNQPKDQYKKACDAMSTKDLCTKMSQCGVVMCVERLFNEWQEKAALKLGDGSDVKVAIVDPQKKGSFGAEINSGNYALTGGFKSDSGLKISAGTVLVIFDDDGKIFKAQYGDPESSDTPLALSQPFCGSNGFYTYGFIVLNGLKSTYDNFSSAIFHEIGHIYGLDHSQPQSEIFDGDIYNVKTGDEPGLTTMYPKLLNGEAGAGQLDLHVDDIVGLARLYPSDDFQEKFCTIEGDLLDADGKPYQGINMIAYPESDGMKLAKAISFVSGAFYQACSDSGHYILPGLVPGTPYNVIYEPVFPEFRNFTTGLNPYDTDKCNLQPALDEEGGFVVAKDGNKLIACDVSISKIEEEDSKGGLLSEFVLANLVGTVSVSDKNNIDVGESTLTSKPESINPADEKKKGWCMSIAGGVDPVMWVWWPVLVAGFAVIRKRIKN